MASLEDFTAFLQSKAYDVLSDGAFKKHLVHSRDGGEAWAIQMHTRQARVTAECRVVQAQALGAGGKLASVCKDVMASAQPPVKVFTGYSKCSLTGEHTDYSIDLTRNSKGAPECHVHPRFWHFFVMLWFVAKVEYVARACTKQWAEQHRGEDKDYTRLCKLFEAENAGLAAQLHGVFVKSVSYVSRSVELYREESEVQPVLQPPPSFFQKAGETDG